MNLDHLRKSDNSPLPAETPPSPPPLLEALTASGDLASVAETSWLRGLKEITDAAEQSARLMDLVGRLVLTDATGRSCFVWDEQLDRYRGPYSRTATPKALLQLCPSLAKKLVDRAGKPAPPEEVFHSCSRIVKDLRYVAGLPGGEYSPETETLRIPAAPWAEDLIPEENPRIAGWLRVLTGDSEYLHGKLLDWLATFRTVTLPTTALYLYGESGIGKGLLVDGLARLYRSQAKITYRAITGDFQDLLLRTGLVVADERLISAGLHQDSDSARFRSLVGDRHHVINLKGLPATSLEGALRIIITANNARAIQIAEALDPDDVDAIARRLLVLPAGRAAREYLDSLGGNAETVAWVAGGALARHVLWLEKTRTVIPGSRFLVELNPESLVGARDIADPRRLEILDLLCRYLELYDPLRRPPPPGTPSLGGVSNVAGILVVPSPSGSPPQDVLVNSTSLAEVLPRLSPGDRGSPRTLGLVLASLGGSVRERVPGTPLLGYRVPGKLLLSRHPSPRVFEILEKTP